MPLTPPDYLPGYTASACGGIQGGQLPYGVHSGTTLRHEEHVYERKQHHTQAAVFPGPAPIAYQQQQLPPLPYNLAGDAMTHSEQLYGPIAAPVLPPIRVQERPGMEEIIAQHRRQQQQQQQSRTDQHPRDEKAVGGVAAYLDYEMDQMSEFVSEMAQGMYDLYVSRICLADIDIVRSVHPGSPAPQAFRKYVSQILSSTRLPSSTILLGLYYLATRMTMLSANGNYKASSGQVYRMLTTSLLLGSKFLDDNTFQNRSWSEVSNIPVTELNTLEIEWLLAINWNMHVDPYDNQGFMSWRSHWEDWQEKIATRAADALKLTPLDTNVRRERSVHKALPPAPLYPPQYVESSYGSIGIERQLAQFRNSMHYDPWSSSRSSMDLSPPSASGTGPNTPDYYGQQGPWSYNPAPPPYTLRSIPSNIPPAALLPSQPPSYHHTPYVHPYRHNTWNGHGSGCGCLYCARHQESYFMGHNFGAQSVAG
ncbi:hypothetical protein MMC16_000123 [Acarospora aff. strigata]|nr:hypothetical protein [Acarospora aff. strigata]